MVVKMFPEVEGIDVWVVRSASGDRKQGRLSFGHWS